MPVVVRMARHGGRSNPFYRVVVADSRFPKEGRYIEAIGTYNPMMQPPVVNINPERLAYWHAKGAQLSNIVADLTKKMLPKTAAVAKVPKADKPAKAPKIAKAATAPKVAKAAKAEKTTKKPKASAKKG
jgi:small subunit ribosomal protein S16